MIIHNPLWDCYRKEARYTRVEARRENNSFEGTLLTLQTHPTSKRFLCEDVRVMGLNFAQGRLKHGYV